MYGSTSQLAFDALCRPRAPHANATSIPLRGGEFSAPPPPHQYYPHYALPQHYGGGFIPPPQAPPMYSSYADARQHFPNAAHHYGLMGMHGQQQQYASQQQGFATGVPSYFQQQPPSLHHHQQQQQQTYHSLPQQLPQQHFATPASHLPVNNDHSSHASRPAPSSHSGPRGLPAQLTREPHRLQQPARTDALPSESISVSLAAAAALAPAHSNPTGQWHGDVDRRQGPSTIPQPRSHSGPSTSAAVVSSGAASHAAAPAVRVEFPPSLLDLIPPKYRSAASVGNTEAEVSKWRQQRRMRYPTDSNVARKSAAVEHAVERGAEMRSSSNSVSHRVKSDTHAPATSQLSSSSEMMGASQQANVIRDDAAGCVRDGGGAVISTAGGDVHRDDLDDADGNDDDDEQPEVIGSDMAAALAAAARDFQRQAAAAAAALLAPPGDGERGGGGSTKRDRPVGWEDGAADVSSSPAAAAATDGGGYCPVHDSAEECRASTCRLSYETMRSSGSSSSRARPKPSTSGGRNNNAPSICRWFLLGTCRSGSSCVYSHGAATVPVAAAASHSRGFDPRNKNGAALMRGALLARLLAPEVAREQSMLLQCVRYIVHNDFFDARGGSALSCTAESTARSSTAGGTAAGDDSLDDDSETKADAAGAI